METIKKAESKKQVQAANVALRTDIGLDAKSKQMFDLIKAFKVMLERTDGDEDDYAVSVEEISVKDRIVELLERIEGCRDGVEFTGLFPEKPTKLLIITTFLAMLEMMKMQAVRIYQNTNFSTIYLYPVTEDSPSQAPADQEAHTEGDA